jgi:hypothetical protein
MFAGETSSTGHSASDWKGESYSAVSLAAVIPCLGLKKMALGLIPVTAPVNGDDAAVGHRLASSRNFLQQCLSVSAFVPVPYEMMPKDSKGPWMYRDPDGHEYLVQLVPMEKHGGLPDEQQPHALVFETEGGWLRVTPVGHDFDPQQLSDEQLYRILRLAAGRQD